MSEELSETRRGLYVQLPLEVIHDPLVSHAAKITYARLLFFAGDDGRCNPSQETLAQEVILSSRQVRTVLTELRKRGWITSKRTRTSCWYEITGPLPDRKKTASLTPERKETSDLDSPDRKFSAGEIGSFPPVRSEENFRQKDFRKDYGKNVEHSHTPNASKVEGAVSQRFDEIWQRWPRKEKRDRAFRDWCSFVTLANEAAVIACVDRYLGSDEVDRAVVKHFCNFLEDQHRDGWAGEWPAVTSPQERRQAAEDRMWKREISSGT